MSITCTYDHPSRGRSEIRLTDNGFEVFSGGKAGQHSWTSLTSADEHDLAAIARLFAVRMAPDPVTWAIGDHDQAVEQASTLARSSQSQLVDLRRELQELQTRVDLLEGRSTGIPRPALSLSLVSGALDGTEELEVALLHEGQTHHIQDFPIPDRASDHYVAELRRTLTERWSTTQPPAPGDLNGWISLAQGMAQSFFQDS